MLKMAYFPLLCAGSTRGFFSGIHCENLLELLEVKLTKVWGSSDDWSPGDFNSQSCPSQPPVIHQLQFSFSYSGISSCRGYLGSLSTYVSNLGCSSLPCNLNSLMDPRRMVGFPLDCAYFLLSLTSKLLTCCTRQRKSSIIIGWHDFLKIDFSNYYVF